MELEHIIDEIGANSMPKSKPPTYKYGSSTYNVLAYAYAYDKALTIDDFQELSNKAFTDKNVIKKALNVLEENKAMVRLNDTYWRITANGMKQALELAREHNPKVSKPNSRRR
jgi:hypothetical protein